MRLVLLVVIPDQHHVCLVKVGYLLCSGVCFSLASRHFGLVQAEVVVFRLCVVDYATGRMVTHRVMLVLLSLSGLPICLQNLYSSTARCGLLLYVSHRHWLPRNWTPVSFLRRNPTYW